MFTPTCPPFLLFDNQERERDSLYSLEDYPNVIVVNDGRCFVFVIRRQLFKGKRPKGLLRLKQDDKINFNYKDESKQRNFSIIIIYKLNITVPANVLNSCIISSFNVIAITAEISSGKDREEESDCKCRFYRSRDLFTLPLFIDCER